MFNDKAVEIEELTYIIKQVCILLLHIYHIESNAYESHISSKVDCRIVGMCVNEQCVPEFYIV